jgi:hypothetical protein
MICEIAAIGTNSADLKWFEQMCSAPEIITAVMPALI